MEKEVKNNAYNDLNAFYGTEGYHPGWLKVRVTDGVNYLRDKYKCSWLVSDICSVIKTQPFGEDFICIEVKVKNSKAEFLYTDGNNNALFKQKYKWTDLPDGEIKLYCVDDILMLSGEY
jgi:hypothetical protein